MTPLEQYLERRSWLSNQATQFQCPDSCPRYGCKDPALHVPVTLMDLVLESVTVKASPSEIYRRFYKIGWSPDRDVPWVGHFTLGLRKPCGFLEEPWCRIYPARPIGCSQFPEAWYLWRGGDRYMMDGTRFDHYPCLQSPPPISKEREKHLAELSEMAAQEGWMSDFYLFGFSPYHVDLRNLVGELMERAQHLGMMTESAAPVAPQVVPYPLVEAFFQEKLEETDLPEMILEKVSRLDSPEERVSFMALKEASDEIQKSLGPEAFVIYNRIEGKTLQSHRVVRRKPGQMGDSEESVGGEKSGHYREEKRAPVQCPSSGSFFQEIPKKGLSVSQHQPGRNQDRDRRGGSS